MRDINAYLVGGGIAFNVDNVAHSNARLIDRNRFRVEVTSMGLSMQDRLELLKLTETDEAIFGTDAITDWHQAFTSAGITSWMRRCGPDDLQGSSTTTDPAAQRRSCESRGG